MLVSWPHSLSWIIFHVAHDHPDLGKVLAGIQVPPNEAGEFDEFLRALGYTYVEETDNEMYKKYLRG